ncbi:unnamed protein product [Coregonus sp. 'balchen']|nr:unnamed protein product [Coregonus sp. 'balchen']
MVVEQKIELSNMVARLKDSDEQRFDQADEQWFELRLTKKEMEELKTENTAELSGMGARVTASEKEEQKKEVSITKIELQLQKNKVDELERENAALKARVTASEREVEELERENTALKARVTASEREVEELERENAALKARVTASEREVEELERENAALKASDMTASEREVEELERENAALKARVTASEREVEELKTENIARPKMAFFCYSVSEARALELAEVEELETKLNQWAVSANPEHGQDNGEARVYGDIQHSVQCYLEACVCCGNIDRAHRSCSATTA